MKAKNRWQAFALHLLISTIILVFLLVIIFFSWYPNDLIHAGGIDGLKILFGVDIILGPLLTLIVFKPGKPGLKTDLLQIGALQSICLASGLWFVYGERPLIEVIVDDGVYILAAADAKKYELDFESIPGNYPKKVFMELPEDQSQWGAVRLMSEIADARPFSTRVDLYKALSTVTDEVFANRIKLIQEHNPSDLGVEASEYDSTGDCAWIPLISVHTEALACISKDKGIVKLNRSLLSK